MNDLHAAKDLGVKVLTPRELLTCLGISPRPGRHPWGRGHARRGSAARARAHC